MFVFPVLGILGVIFVSGGNSLDFRDFREGSCGQYKPQENLNETWFHNARLPYVAGGSKYHLYRMAVGHSGVARLKESDFLQKACLQNYVNAPTGIGLVFGFGLGIIGNFTLRLTPQKGVIDFVPLLSQDLTDVSQHVVTLTDNKSFVFFANCWKDSKEKGWDLVSLTPTLDANTQKMVEDHAASIGFDKKQFIFFPKGNCNLVSMALGSI